MRLILASQSPRRRELLRSGGVHFELATAAHGINEEQVLAEQVLPAEKSKLMLLAELKGRRLASENPDSCVLSADTEVVYRGQMLGKPADELAALRMIELLAARRHEVITAVSLQCRCRNICLTREESTSVWFRELSHREIRDYVQRAQPFDFAGGYAIQGEGAALVERIEGDYTNVIGLPLKLTLEMLKEAGIRPVPEPHHL